MRPKLFEEAICQKEASLLASGALAVGSGRHTDLLPHSLFKVDSSNSAVPNERSLDRERAQDFFRDLESYLAGSRVFEVRGYVGPLPIEFLTTSAWHAAFCEMMFRDRFLESLSDQVGRIPGAYGTLRVFHDPGLKPSLFEISASAEAMTLLDPEAFRIGIIGTAFAGEITNAIYATLDILLPRAGLLPLRAAALADREAKRTCLLMGAPGSGKSTLAQRSRDLLIADDAVVWSDAGLSNLFGGCYARLDRDLAAKVDHFGSILENATVDAVSRTLDFSYDELGAAGRAAFSLERAAHVYSQDSEAPVPDVIVFLVKDLEGSLPLVAKLENWSHDVPRLTREVVGIDHVHGLERRIAEAGCEVWLLNTGWLNDERIPIETTAGILDTIRAGGFTRFERDSYLGLNIPLKLDVFTENWPVHHHIPLAKAGGLLLSESF